MRLVAYLRVSTDRQADDGEGLDSQEHEVRKWAKAHGHRIVGTCTDVISGTTPLPDRNGLMCVLDHLAEGTAQGMVLWRLDRFARELVTQEQLLQELWRSGAEVFSTAAAEQHLRNDPDDPSRKLIRQILGAVNEYEREMIVLRLRLGRRRKAARGGYAGYGSPAYGWRAVDRSLVPDEQEQAARARIADLRASGASIREIIGVLDREGHTPKRGGRWHPTTISRILNRS